MSKNTLFYDGQCPLCVREMDKLGSTEGCLVELVDIHSLKSSDALPSQDELLRKLHLQRADGEMVVGLEANIIAWQGTRYAALWRVLRWPLINQVANLCYERWAKWRYARMQVPPKA